jgi:hypothetical protein
LRELYPCVLRSNSQFSTPPIHLASRLCACVIGHFSSAFACSDCNYHCISVPTIYCIVVTYITFKLHCTDFKFRNCINVPCTSDPSLLKPQLSSPLRALTNKWLASSLRPQRQRSPTCCRQTGHKGKARVHVLPLKGPQRQGSGARAQAVITAQSPPHGHTVIHISSMYSTVWAGR